MFSIIRNLRLIFLVSLFMSYGFSAKGAIVSVVTDGFYTSSLNVISKPADRFFASVLGPRATLSEESFSFDGKWKVWGDVSTQLIHSKTYTSIFIDLKYQHIIPDPAAHTPATQSGEIFSLKKVFRTDSTAATYDPAGSGSGSLIVLGATGNEKHHLLHSDSFNVNFFFALNTTTGPTGSPTTGLTAWRIGLSAEHNLTRIPLPPTFSLFVVGLAGFGFLIHVRRKNRSS